MWKLPLETGKKLQFNDVGSYFYRLKMVNDNKVSFDTKVQFKVGFNKEIFLSDLFPHLPTISGLDVIQFLMSVSFVCNFQLVLNDESDLSHSYPYAYGQGIGYYDVTVKGLVNAVSYMGSINTILFLQCTKEILLSDIVVGVSYEIQLCKDHQTPMITPQNCPLVHNWLGKFLFKTVFPKCVANQTGKYPNWGLPEKKYTITQHDLGKEVHEISATNIRQEMRQGKFTL